MADTSATSYDLAVIGGGPGGYVAAIRAAQAGLGTVLVEQAQTLGGVCLNSGCIPTKSLLRSAEAFELARKGAEYGFNTGEVTADFGRVMTRSREIPSSIVKGIDYLMKKNGVTVVHGHATLAGGDRITVAGASPSEFTARDIIIATGAHPSRIPGIEPDGHRVLTSDHILALETCPTSILIIGAGAIGVQFASFFATFGAAVTLVDIAGSILPFADSEVSKRLAYTFRKRGITIQTEVAVQSMEAFKSNCRTSFSNGASLETDVVLVAAGYTGNVDGIGLETAGVACERGFITVNDDFRTSAPRISAIGDCIGQPMLAHAASVEGERAVEAILGKPSRRLDPNLVPIAIYSHPQVASVGLTQEEAHIQGYSVFTGVCPFKVIGKAVAVGETGGFVKVIIDRETGLFLGAHVIGPDADETIQEVVLAMHADVPAEELAATIHPHPTLAEAVREATMAALGWPLNT